MMHCFHFPEPISTKVNDVNQVGYRGPIDELTLDAVGITYI